jgi:hypothetical protein
MGETIMRKKIFWSTILSGMLLQLSIFVSVTFAQDKDNKVVVIKSEPPGAMLYFQGENSFVGVTPFVVKPNLIGNYKIVVVKTGYEKSKMEYFFKGSEKGVLRLRLTPKTRFKAGVRSLVFPGWGQMYSERKTSGIFLNLVQAGAGLVTLMAHLDYNKSYDRYKTAWDDYKANEKYAELRTQKWEILEAKYNKADDAFNKRETWLYISGGLWLYNFLDALIFFPAFENEIFNRSLPGVSANFQHDSVGLTLTFAF